MRIRGARNQRHSLAEILDGRCVATHPSLEHSEGRVAGLVVRSHLDRGLELLLCLSSFSLLRQGQSKIHVRPRSWRMESLAFRVNLAQGYLELSGHIPRRVESQRLFEAEAGRRIPPFTLKKLGRVQIGGVEMWVGADRGPELALRVIRLPLCLAVEFREQSARQQIAAFAASGFLVPG